MDADYREELETEGRKARRQIKKLKDEIRDLSKARKDKVKALEERCAEIDDELDGVTHSQPSLPLTTPRGPGLSVALKENGAGVSDAEVREARKELHRQKRAREATVDVKALPAKGETTGARAGRAKAKRNGPEAP